MTDGPLSRSFPMRLPPSASLLALPALAIALLLPSSAHACSCVGPGDDGWGDTFKQSDGAVIAKLIDVRPIGTSEYPRNSNYIYEITEVFKRDDRFEPGQTRRIKSATDGAACGIERPIGSTHALFLLRSQGGWYSNLCLSLLSKREMREAAEAAGSGQSRGSAPCGGMITA